MAIIPGKKNFTVDRRADFPIMMNHVPQNMQIGQWLIQIEPTES